MVKSCSKEEEGLVHYKSLMHTRISNVFDPRLKVALLRLTFFFLTVLFHTEITREGKGWVGNKPTTDLTSKKEELRIKKKKKESILCF